MHPPAFPVAFAPIAVSGPATKFTSIQYDAVNGFPPSVVQTAFVPA